MSSSVTFYQALASRSERQPDSRACTEWKNGAIHRVHTNKALRAQVDGIAAGLREAGVAVGDRVLVVLPNEVSFVAVLIACVAVGATAVPAPVPTIGRRDAYQERLRRIAADCDPRFLVTLADWFAQVGELVGSARACRVLSWEDLAGTAPGTRVEPAVNPVAFLQYTSGSTSQPRGVVVTHEMLAASCGQAAEAYRETAEDVAVTWVPLYHDMGLITGVFRPLHTGYESVLMSPDEFLRSPVSWLNAIQASRGTLSSAPNFAFDHCVRKIGAQELGPLDLSTWRVARNAGEVVSAATVDRFTKHFGAAGFGSTALCPSYGLAEATLTVTTCSPEIRPVDLVVSAADMERGVVRDAGAGGRRLTSSGRPVAGTRVLIERPEGRDVGEILVSGPQLSPGYWPLSGAGGEAGGGRWHRTGDLGFLRDGHLYVLGRADDVLIVRGRNYYMADVSAACWDIEGLRRGRFAVFGIPDTDKACLVAELAAHVDRSADALDRLAAQTVRTLARDLGLGVATVGFVEAGSLPVTTSGKVRVSEVARRALHGRLELRHLAGPGLAGRRADGTARVR